MEKKTKYLIITFIFAAVIIITGTFAWLTYQSKKTALVFTVGEASTMQISLQPYQINAEIDPEMDYTDVEHVNVTAVNNQEEAMNYTLFYEIDEIDQDLLTTDFKYTIERSTNNGETYSEYITGDFSEATTTAPYVILDEDIPANGTYKYRVYVWLDGYTNPNTGIEGAVFSAELKADIVGFARAYIVDDITGGKNYYKEDTYREHIVSASFVNHMNVPGNAVATYNIGTRANHPITAWLVPAVENGTYDLYIGANEAIYAKKTSNMFRNMSALVTINFGNLNTSESTNMSAMFYNCTSLATLNTSAIDTSSATSLIGIFYNCSSLTTLDLSSWDTSGVTSMGGMFQDCTNLQNVNLTGFNTSLVTSFNSMFKNCSSLTTLNLSNFYTPSLRETTSMFSGCINLTTINISNFDTSSVTMMSSMFYNCRSLTSLDLSHFVTSKVTFMNSMFYNCTELKTLNLSNWDTKKVKNMEWMFGAGDDAVGPMNLETITGIEYFDTQEVTNMGYMFRRCYKLTSLDLHRWNVAKVETMRQMFKNCTGLETLSLTGWNLASLTNTSYMFQSASKLNTTFPLTADSTKLTTYTSMFTSAATQSGASIIVDYTSTADSIVDAIVATGGANVVKGSLIPQPQ